MSPAMNNAIFGDKRDLWLVPRGGACGLTGPRAAWRVSCAGWAQCDVQVTRQARGAQILGESPLVPAVPSCKHLIQLQALELFRALSAHDLIYPRQSSKSEGVSQETQP